MKHIFANISKTVLVNLNLADISCILDGLTTSKKFSALQIIGYSMPKHEKQINY